MGRPLPILLAASLSLFAAPALAEEEPPPAAPTPAPSPSHNAYNAYSAYSAPAPDGALSPLPEGHGEPLRPRTESLRPGMMPTGIVFVGLGVTAMTTGTVIYASRIRDCTAFDLNGQQTAFSRCPDDSAQYIGMTILITGGVVAALGIPLWIFGASSVPVRAAPRTAKAPTLLVGPRSAALRFTF